MSRPGGRLAVGALLAAGVGLRLGFLLTASPILLGDPDAGAYIDAAHRGLFSNPYDPAGYPLFLQVLHFLVASLWLVAVVQDLLALATAALLYDLMRRAGARRWSLVPPAIVLLDGYVLWVGQTPITETLFTFLVCAALYLTIRSRASSRAWLAGAGGAVGIAATVRPVGLVLLPVLLVWLLLERRPGRRGAAIDCLVYLIPLLCVVGICAVAQDNRTGVFGLTRDSGRVLYARAAGFADCHRFRPPVGTTALCERTPPARRGSFNQYLTGFPDHAADAAAVNRNASPAWRVFGAPPAGNGRLAAFGLAAITHQPLDYLSAVAGDVHYFWADDHHAFVAGDARPDPGSATVVRSYYGGGSAPRVTGFFAWYGKTVQLHGVLVVLLLVAALLAPWVRGSPDRALTLLLSVAGLLLPLVAVAVASVDPRFLLPSYGPLAAAGCLGAAGVRAPRGPSLKHGQQEAVV